MLYLPTPPSHAYVPDKFLQNIPGEIGGFPLSISFGGAGGRLWGIGFALPKAERKSPSKNVGYQILRVDYHGAQHRDHLHRPPYASFFSRTQNSWEFHWQIPDSPKDARGGAARK